MVSFVANVFCVNPKPFFKSFFYSTTFTPGTIWCLIKPRSKNTHFTSMIELLLSSFPPQKKMLPFSLQKKHRATAPSNRPGRKQTARWSPAPQASQSSPATPRLGGLGALGLGRFWVCFFFLEEVLVVGEGKRRLNVLKYGFSMFFLPQNVFVLVFAFKAGRCWGVCCFGSWMEVEWVSSF